MKGLHMIAFILLVIGGLNWLGIAAFDTNYVEKLGSGVAMLAYWLVGLSAIYEGVTHGKRCRECKGNM